MNKRYKIALRLFSWILGMNKHYRISKCIENKGSLIAKTKFLIKEKNNHITIEEGCRIENCTFYINGSNNSIYIGAETRLLHATLWEELDSNSINLGKHNKGNGSITFAAMEGTKIVIGDNNLFARNICFRTSDSHSILDFEGHRINKAKNIMIGNHNWFSEEVTFLKGSCIGNNNVIGYRSLLTKEFLVSNCVLVGSSGGVHVIKDNVQWQYEYK